VVIGGGAVSYERVTPVVQGTNLFSIMSPGGAAPLCLYPTGWSRDGPVISIQGPLPLLHTKKNWETFPKFEKPVKGYLPGFGKSLHFKKRYPPVFRMGATYHRGTPVHRNQEIKSLRTSWPAIAQQPPKSSHSSQELLPREPTHLEICSAAVMLVP
jgi:hypothetical protein